MPAPVLEHLDSGRYPCIARVRGRQGRTREKGRRMEIEGESRKEWEEKSLIIYLVMFQFVINPKHSVCSYISMALE